MNGVQLPVMLLLRYKVYCYKQGSSRMLDLFALTFQGRMSRDEAAGKRSWGRVLLI